MSTRLVSNAARFAGQAGRAALAHAQRASASAAGTAFESAEEAARIGSYTVPTVVLSSTDTGAGTAKISIADHTRVYPVQGNVDVPDVALAAVPDVTALLNATVYDCYYDDVDFADPALASTAPVVQVTTDPKVAQVGYAPGRHYLGKITTAAAGGGATGGSGGLPPGGGGGGNIP